MRAVLIDRPGPPDVLTLRDVPIPQPGPGELSIDVDLAGVGFVDTLFRAGAFPIPSPFVPGIEVAGSVRALGRGVTGFRTGQPVAALLNDFGRGERAGGYAEVAVAAADMTTPVPDGTDPAVVLAALVNGVTGWLALHDLARLGSTEHVVVLGASGGLGGTTSRLAAVAPAASVIGVVGSEARRSSAAAECTAVVLADELGEALPDLTGGHGADVVLDPVGGDLRVAAWNALAPFGRLVIVGNASGDDPGISFDDAWHGNRQVLGLSLGGAAHLIPDRVAAALAAVVGLVSRGVLREPPPAIVPLERAAEVHAQLENRTAPAKTVLAVRT